MKNDSPTPAPGALPELPEADGQFCASVRGELDAYSSEQMHAYARAYAEQCRAGGEGGMAEAVSAGTIVLYRDLLDRADRLVKHADFQLGGAISANSKMREIPSRACSSVKARHLASLRDAVAALQSAFADDEGVK